MHPIPNVIKIVGPSQIQLGEDRGTTDSEPVFHYDFVQTSVFNARPLGAILLFHQEKTFTG